MSTVEEIRSVDLPDDLRSVLCDVGRLEAFAALSCSYQREYVMWIEDAKDPRARRVNQTIDRVRI